MSEGQGDGGLGCESHEGDGGLECEGPEGDEMNTGGSVEEYSAEDQGMNLFQLHIF